MLVFCDTCMIYLIHMCFLCSSITDVHRCPSGVSADGSLLEFALEPFKNFRDLHSSRVFYLGYMLRESYAKCCISVKKPLWSAFRTHWNDVICAKSFRVRVTGDSQGVKGLTDKAFVASLAGLAKTMLTDSEVIFNWFKSLSIQVDQLRTISHLQRRPEFAAMIQKQKESAT